MVVDQFTVAQSAALDDVAKKRKARGEMSCLFVALLGLVWLGASIWVAVGLVRGTTQWSVAYLTLFIGVPFGLRAIYRRSEQLSSATGREVVSRDGRQPILYLRPFGADEGGRLGTSLARGVFFGSLRTWTALKSICMRRSARSAP